MKRGGTILLVLCCTFLIGFSSNATAQKHKMIFDSDTNNEVDDQHALAYLLYSGDYFDLLGVTVNATSSPEGGSVKSDVQDHYDEALRVMKLCGRFDREIPLYKGANGSFEEIENDLGSASYDGHEAVDFIIERAMQGRDRKLILLAVGKLTNIALALKKEPAIATNVRVVWLGSNYPEPGEHNQMWDVGAMNYLLDIDVPFEMVTVRYDRPSGTTAVRVTLAQIQHRMPGMGPTIATPVTGRNGGQFDNWGDYSVDLFETYQMYGDPEGRSLFDLAAVAILKNPDWAERKEIPAPRYVDDQWVERPENPRTITIWEWFDIYGIMNDFFLTMRNPVPVSGK